MASTNPGNSRAVAQLLLRAAVGGTLIAHGVKHGRTLEQTASWFHSIGFRDPQLQARASAMIEIGAGSALAAGAVVPISAAAVIGTMGVAARSVHLPNGFFITADGWEYVMNLSAAAIALAALGAGPFSVDRGLGWDRKLTGMKAAGTAVGLGLAGAAGQLAAYYRKSSTNTPTAV